MPPAQPDVIAGTKTHLIEIGHKGMYVIVAGFYDDPREPIRFQRVALDSRFPNTPEMKQLMVTYQDQLQQLGWEGLGIRSVPHSRARQGDALAGKFVGAAECKDCHEAEWEVWANSKHAHATETLVNLDPPRQYDAECISCHSTGWNPQEFFPYATGFDSVESTPHLVGNGCENCHGPGAAHVAAENGEADEAERDALRQSLHLVWDKAKTDTCTQCHDGDNSPEFGGNVEHYWSEIAHYAHAQLAGAGNRAALAGPASRPLKNALVAFFNLAKCEAKLRTARKITTYIAILASHPCDDAAR